MNRQAAYLTESLRVDLQGAAADKPITRDGNEERRHVRKILLDQLLGKQPDQAADTGHVALSRGANFNTKSRLGHGSHRESMLGHASYSQTK